jgi:hypothetical protein
VGAIETTPACRRAIIGREVDYVKPCRAVAARRTDILVDPGTQFLQAVIQLVIGDVGELLVAAMIRAARFMKFSHDCATYGIMSAA